ncbi:Hypothetical protein A7982_08159 [Minicystis rosea]|nr:Hypothetical protein A7982_08159 [Minicystis rosea]
MREDMNTQLAWDDLCDGKLASTGSRRRARRKGGAPRAQRREGNRAYQEQPTHNPKHRCLAHVASSARGRLAA